MRGKVMNAPAEYGDDVERRHTHPLLMPKIESDEILMVDGKILMKVAVVSPAKPPTKKTRKGILQGIPNKSISPRAKPATEQRSV